MFLRITTLGKSVPYSLIIHHYLCTTEWSS